MPKDRDLQQEKQHRRVEIRVTAGPAKGRHLVCDKVASFVCGRSPDAHISLPSDRYISRQHFSLHVAPPECTLRDLGSTNGVIVNGVRYGGTTPTAPGIRQAPFNEVCLKDGDEIIIGNTRINISIHPFSQNDRSNAACQENKNDASLNRCNEAIQQTATPQQEAAMPEEVALLLIDLVGSTQHLLRMGDQQFSDLIEQIRYRFDAHRSVSDRLSLRYTGDGFLATYKSATKALSMAADFLKTPIRQDVHIRIALHWGAVKMGTNGDVLGKAVQQVRQFEGLQGKDRIGTTATVGKLPEKNRVLITKPVCKRLSPANRKKFTFAGVFSLDEDSQDICALWFFQKP
ncbi:hypothetical protein CSA56_16705 [candidate division KSB3 bacterium]|uniref:Adenylate/guanylate cyclase domain-containing protein n=1 Tax=candidate division KSB3 bacterium TaxID=2044937 RepID=A0A2G6K8K3_9BACT|nr:MAG: hypothetical protein CSA56_16705 [candidate division KSB3 bacterium]